MFVGPSFCTEIVRCLFGLSYFESVAPFPVWFWFPSTDLMRKTSGGRPCFYLGKAAQRFKTQPDRGRVRGEHNLIQRSGATLGGGTEAEQRESWDIHGEPLSMRDCEIRHAMCSEVSRAGMRTLWHLRRRAQRITLRDPLHGEQLLRTDLWSCEVSLMTRTLRYWNDSS